MSVRVMNMVFERYPNGGGEMLLALALADHSHDDGCNIYPSIAQLATKTRQSERAVQYQLRRMEEMGWIELVNAGDGGRGRRREYRINAGWIKGAELAPIARTNGADVAPTQKGATDDTKGATNDGKGCNSFAPTDNRKEPSKKRQSSSFDASLIDLPDWLPRELWQRWCKDRKTRGKPITEEGARLQVRKLDLYRADGHSPTTVLEHCMEGGYQGLFAPKVQGPGAPAAPVTVPSKLADQTAEYLASRAEQDKAAFSPEAEAARKAAMARVKGGVPA